MPLWGSLIAAVYVLAWTKNLADHNQKKGGEE